MAFFPRIPNPFRRRVPAAVAEQATPGATHPDPGHTRVGRTPTPENHLSRIYRQFHTDPTLRAAILDIREMQRLDPRVKKIHGRMSRSATKGGLRLKTATTNRRLHREWRAFLARTGLNRPEKLQSDCRGLVMEGNLPLQIVLDGDNRVTALVRMPSETIVPIVGENGQFQDVRYAYEQRNPFEARALASFALWQLDLARLDPDNYDDMGSMGRPYLDATRSSWQKLIMTEEDTVIRRRTRAPMRTSHVLEGAEQDELERYREAVEQDKNEVTTDYYSTRKPGPTAIQGDANLDQIKDVVHLLDTFFSGAPAPKGLFGYVGDLSRDVLEDMKRDYYEELDALQDVQASAYEFAFRLHLLLAGLNPDSYDFAVVFSERRTETANQAADRALKYQALGASQQTILRTAGMDPEVEREQLEDELDETDPYPVGGTAGTTSRTSVTPGNARKGESATDVSTSRSSSQGA